MEQIIVAKRMKLLFSGYLSVAFNQLVKYFKYVYCFNVCSVLSILNIDMIKHFFEIRQTI